MKDKLTTSYYKVLEELCNNLASVNDESIAIITQVEISERLGLSTITVNAIFKELRNDGVVKPDKVIGRYKVSEEAIKAVESIKNI